jgi:putative ABC transport system permease protein
VGIVSHRLGRGRWGADPGIIGRSVRVDGEPVTIVGVMPPDVAAPDPKADIWVPAGFRSRERWDRHSRRLNVYGRLRSGVTLEQCQRDLSRIAVHLQTGEFSDIYEGWDALVVPLHEQIVGGARATLLIAFASVGLVLLIACVNIANMLLARASGRQREMAIRGALGAGRYRITRQLLTESVILAVGGGFAGVVFARLAHDLMMTFQPGIIPRAEELSIDLGALVFAFVVSIVTGVFFGLAPALYGNRVDVSEALKQGGSRGMTGARHQNRTRSILVIAQLALATVLLCEAGLLVRSMLELRKVDPGFDTQHGVGARVFLDVSQYDSEEKVVQYFRRLPERLLGLPGVEAVGATSALPMDPLGINYDLPYRLEGQGNLPYEELPQADYRVITPGYFEAIDVPLTAGRMLNHFDRVSSPFVALVNETMARLTWPGKDPIGQRFESPSTTWHWFEVVGVVGDTRYYGLDIDPGPEFYVAHAQAGSHRSRMTVVVRTADPAASVELVRRAVLEEDTGQPSHSVVTLQSLVADSIAAERFYALVLGVFAGVALMLSGAGIYGVLSYWVGQRTHEIGVRMALGATDSKVLGHVVGYGMTLAGVGIAVGLAGSLASTRVLGNVLFGIGATDPLTYAGVSLGLATIALIACGVPAFRASRVDPVLALREE